jgi:predicted ArsR family transcriptional regulator
MDFNLQSLNKDFDSRVRLGIMSTLMVNEWVNFIDMKQILDLSDGNLSSHTLALEAKGYIQIRKKFVSKKTETSYKLTNYGRIEFEKHIDGLATLLTFSNKN